MITRIKVRNFLSLKDVDLDLRPRNVFVGANMSGKSNLIECLKFLRESLSLTARPEVTSLQTAFEKRGGFGEVVWKGNPRGPVQFEISADLGAGQRDGSNEQRYIFSLRLSEYGYAEVEEERLLVQRKGKWETVLENAGSELIVEMAGKSTRQGSKHTLGLALEAMGRQRSSACYELCRFVGNWNFYSLVPALMREGNRPALESRLSEHGENLSAWILTLQTYPEFQTIKQALRDVLPGLAEILFQPVQQQKQPSPQGILVLGESNKISVGTSEARFDKPIGIARMSDGELAFLALVSLILAPAELSPVLMCLEEPENYLHPRLLEILVELLNQRQIKIGAPQIILTTHSPLLVNKLTLEDLIVTEKVEGATVFTRASSKKHLKRLLARKEVSLGDLWYSGALNGS